MLDNGNEKDWFSSPVIVVAGVVSLVSVAFLIPWELTDKHPVIDLNLFARRNFRVGTIVIGVSFRVVRRQCHFPAVAADHGRL